MSRSVLLTDGAARDLDELYADAYDRAGDADADRLLDRIQTCFERLADETAAGRPLPELRSLGFADGRALRDGDLRYVYRLGATEVLLVAIAHHDRSMQSLLLRRTLDA